MTDFTITLYTLYAIKQKYLRYNIKYPRYFLFKALKNNSYINSILLLTKLLKDSPLSILFCNKAKSINWRIILFRLA